MNDLKLDLNAEILPDEGLGGLKLRINVSELERIEGFTLLKQDSYCMVSPFEARYQLGGGEIEAAVDVRREEIEHSKIELIQR